MQKEVMLLPFRSHSECSKGEAQCVSTGWRQEVCLFSWGLTALSAQIGYIAP